MHIYRVSQENVLRLIWYKLKTTVFTRSAFIFSESSYFNLKFGINPIHTGGGCFSPPGQQIAQNSKTKHTITLKLGEFPKQALAKFGTL